jgi:hypothetical protein
VENARRNAGLCCYLCSITITSCHLHILWSSCWCFNFISIIWRLAFLFYKISIIIIMQIWISSGVDIKNATWSLAYNSNCRAGICSFRLFVFLGSSLSCFSFFFIPFSSLIS